MVISFSVPQPDLDDDEKRWLIVGICLHTVLNPALRKYIEPEINNVYSKLVSGRNIHTQTYTAYMKKYPPGRGYTLNYEAINNNKSTHRWQISLYDYNVKSAVEFSKLFLPTHMSHYSAFDDSCDASAVLGLIINIKDFPTNVKTTAEDIRKNIRNPWAHCNLPDWDGIKYQSCFQRMEQMIRYLGLQSADETKCIQELRFWNMTGTYNIHSYNIIIIMLLKRKQRLVRYLIVLILSKHPVQSMDFSRYQIIFMISLSSP